MAHMDLSDGPAEVLADRVMASPRATGPESGQVERVLRPRVVPGAVVGHRRPAVR